MAKINYTQNDLEQALKAIGLKAGDNLFIHSNIGFFGNMDNALSAQDLCKNFTSAIRNVISEEGTLVLPTFSYSFCHSEIYNPKTTKSDCGMLTTYTMELSDTYRSLDPNFSITTWGKNAIYYTEKPTHESFGAGSFWERLLSTGGKIVCMNFDCGSTFIHFVERYCSVDYRYNKAFNGTIITYDGKSYRDYAVHYVHDGGADAPYTGRLDKKCRESGICHTVKLGKGTILAMDIQEYFDLIVNTLKVEPRFLTLGG